ncbi:hypothetical protein [Cognatishimia sp. MH4019]|uniref:hypothetical protein n=1 Tax=Cognatishimia sp. MH4019 TaxID=2854030 RepID=UPI001CD7B94C|nr:hypothetical protein [Cognatishimia sp. MH4019]
MKLLKATLVLALGVAVSGCANERLLREGPRNTIDKTVDAGRDTKDLSQLKAGVWIDPNGCDHWIIDDGVEGYLSARLDKYGKPVCSGAAPPGVATGPFKSGSSFPDTI